MDTTLPVGAKVDGSQSATVGRTFGIVEIDGAGRDPTSQTLWPDQGHQALSDRHPSIRIGSALGSQKGKESFHRVVNSTCAGVPSQPPASCAVGSTSLPR